MMGDPTAVILVIDYLIPINNHKESKVFSAQDVVFRSQNSFLTTKATQIDQKT